MWLDWIMNSEKHFFLFPGVKFHVLDTYIKYKKYHMFNIKDLYGRNPSIKISLKFNSSFPCPPFSSPCFCHPFFFSSPFLSSLLSTCVSCSHSPVSLRISVSSFAILEACFLKFAEHLSKEALCLKHGHPKSLCWKSSKYRVKNVWHPGPLGLKCNQLQTFSDLLMLGHFMKWQLNMKWAFSLK